MSCTVISCAQLASIVSGLRPRLAPTVHSFLEVSRRYLSEVRAPQPAPPQAPRRGLVSSRLRAAGLTA